MDAMPYDAFNGPSWYLWMFCQPLESWDDLVPFFWPRMNPPLLSVNDKALRPWHRLRHPLPHAPKSPPGEGGWQLHPWLSAHHPCKRQSHWDCQLREQWQLPLDSGLGLAFHLQELVRAECPLRSSPGAGGSVGTTFICRQTNFSPAQAWSSGMRPINISGLTGGRQKYYERKTGNPML